MRPVIGTAPATTLIRGCAPRVVELCSGLLKSAFALRSKREGLVWTGASDAQGWQWLFPTRRFRTEPHIEARVAGVSRESSLLIQWRGICRGVARANSGGIAGIPRLSTLASRRAAAARR